MSLSMGQSKNRANSSGYNQSWNQQESQDFSQATAQSTSGSTSGQRIAFEDVFAGLFGGASAAAKSALMGAPELATAAKQLFTGGSQFLQGLGGGAGTDYMEERLGGENPVLEEQIAALRDDAGRLFTEELNPAITSRAVAGGTLGGGRQGVAQGLAMEATQREFLRGATELRARDVEQRDAIAAQVAGNSLTAANTGLGALPGLLDLLERGNNSELGVFGALSSILGGPTTLSESSSFGQSTSDSIAQAFAKAYGGSYGQNNSSARGSSWDFGVGMTPTGG